MPLNKQTINVPISKGIDTFTDRKVVAMDKLLLAQNVSFDSDGSIQKRNGYEKLNSELIDGSGFVPTDDPTGITVLGEQTLYTNDQSLYALLDGRWRYVDRLPPTFSRTDRISTSARDQRNPCSATVDQFVWYAWEDSGIKLLVTDLSTGKPLAGVQDYGTGIRPLLTVFNGQVILTYADPSNSRISINSVNIVKVLSNNKNPEAFITGLSADCNYDVVTASNFLNLVLSTDSGTTTTFKRFDVFFQNVATTAVLVASNGCINCYSDLSGNVCVVAVSSTSTSRFFQFDALSVQSMVSNLSASAGTINRVAGAQFSSDSHSLFYQLTNATSGTLVLMSQLSVGALTASNAASTIAANASFLVSKPFSFLDSTAIVVCSSSSIEPSHFVVDGEGYALSRSNVSVAGNRTSSSLPSVSVINDEMSVPVERTEVFPTAGASTFGVMAVNSINLSTSTPEFIRFHDDLHVPGSIMRSYDGTQVTETGYLTIPEVLTSSVSSTGGHIEAGSYLYSFVYRWQDAGGKTHESAPSIPVQVSTGGTTSSTTWKVTALNLTTKSGVCIDGYRSFKRTNDSLDIPFSLFTDPNLPVLNVVNSPGISITDTLSDVQLSSKKVLYTVGGVLENRSPPPCQHATTFGNRLWTMDSDRINTLTFSKQSVEGEPLLFTNDEFTVNVSDDDNEGIGALYALDSNLIVYKPNNVYYLSGEGPDNTNNTTSPYTDPQLISSNVGCDQQRSIVSFKDGLLFKSPSKGIWLLDRSLRTSYVGSDVDAHNDLNIVSAQSVPSRDEVRFLTDSSICLVYNHRVGQWCTWTNHQAVSSTMVNNVFHYLRPSGAILSESTGFADVNKPIQLKIRTAYISFGQVNGFKWLYDVCLLGECKGQHDLKISFAFDYDPNYTKSYTIAASDVIAASNYGTGQYGDSAYGGTWKQERFGIHVSKGRIESASMQIEDVIEEPTESLTISYLSLVVGTMNNNLKPLPGNERMR